MPVAPHQFNPTKPFVVRAIQPGSPIHHLSMNANDGHFWLGKATSSVCPAESDSHCPKGTKTALIVSGNGLASLNVNVPAGQTIYVAKDGALSFTKAYEGNITAVTYPNGFSYDNGANGSGVGTFLFSETPSKGWLACPVVAERGPWQVYAFIRRANATGCLDFEADGETYGGDEAWLYD